jgi:small subunit ribosomal protein S24e
MKIEVIDEKENPLLHRKELTCIVSFEGATPSRKEIVKNVAATKGMNEGLVVADSISQTFGKQEAKCYVKLYEKENFKEAIEQKHILEKPKEKKPEEEKSE